MPEYTIQQVNVITTFINANFVKYNITASAVFNTEQSETVKDNHTYYTNLYYTITFTELSGDYILFVCLKFNRSTNNIELLSTGNKTMPLQKMIHFATVLFEPYVDFQVNKGENIQVALQSLPYTRI